MDVSGFVKGGAAGFLLESARCGSAAARCSSWVITAPPEDKAGHAQCRALGKHTRIHTHSQQMNAEHKCELGRRVLFFFFLF